MGQLAQWKCHKVVRAGKIMKLPVLQQDARAQSTGVYLMQVEDVNGAPAKIEVKEEVFKRGSPSVGDYIVVYDEGAYMSWSPAKVFEEGYERSKRQPDE